MPWRTHLQRHSRWNGQLETAFGWVWEWDLSEYRENYGSSGYVWQAGGFARSLEQGEAKARREIGRINARRAETVERNVVRYACD
jgi:hypothetical protein